MVSISKKTNIVCEILYFEYILIFYTLIALIFYVIFKVFLLFEGSITCATFVGFTAE